MYPRCGRELPTRQFVDDLKVTLDVNYELSDDRGSLQDDCSTRKWVLRGTMYSQLMGKRVL